MKDWRGTEIEVGSVVVYPTRRGSYLAVVEARVDEIVPYDNEEWAKVDGNWQIVIVERYKLKVTRLREGSHVADPKTAKVTIGEVRRVTVVDSPSVTKVSKAYWINESVR